MAAAIGSYLLPAGQYERRTDPVTGRDVVVAGTYHHVDRQPVGPFEALVAIPKGLAEAGSVVFLVFLVGGAFTVVDETGALRQAVGWLVRRLENRETLLIPIVSLAFAAGGALENMSEEIIALVPVLLLVTRRLGFDALTAVAISIGAAGVGAAFSPINPFQVQIAQKLAGVPLLSGFAFRSCVLALALAGWIAGTWRHAAKTRVVPDEHRDAATSPIALDASRTAVLVLVILTFVVFVYGVMRLGWDFDQMSALFFAMGVGAGLIGGLGPGRHRAGVRHGVRIDGLRGDADRLRESDLRRARSRPHHRHDRQRAGHAAAEPAGDSFRARHADRAGRRARSRPKRQRPGGADDAGARADVRSDRAFTSGRHPRVSSTAPA